MLQAEKVKIIITRHSDEPQIENKLIVAHVEKLLRQYSCLL